MREKDRSEQIVNVLTDCFADLMAADPAAFRRRFRKMAADPFAFYRGTACLFYADAAEREDPFANDRTSRVWIEGDLHAANFGTYMDGKGLLVFDVNDFDEAYLGHFTWDLSRLAGSVALLGWTKAIPDDDIVELIETYARSYIRQVRHFVDDDRDHEWALRLDTADGHVRDALLTAQLSTRIDLLDRHTVVEDYSRRFRGSAGVRRLDDAERSKVEVAYKSYLETIPESKRLGSITYVLKDAVGITGVGVGSAGLPTYSLLVEGHTQALENDVILTMKQGNVAAPSRVVNDAKAQQFFKHHGHRTAVSQRALQAHADPWLGWTELDDEGFVVAELSPYVADLDWQALSEPEEMSSVLTQLGRASAKVHCVSDVDTEGDPLLDFQTEDAIAEAVGDDEDGFVRYVLEFGMEYGERARRDHGLFVDAFRAGAISGVTAISKAAP